jgi:hypothetical protein
MKTSLSFFKHRRAPRLLLGALLACGALGVGAPAVIAGLIPTGQPATYPTWWFTNNVVVPLDPTNEAPVWPGDYPAADDYGAINQGQLKQLAAAAYDELQSLPGGTGETLDTLIKSWFQLDGDGNFILVNGARVPKVTAVTDSFAAVNLGQLKALAQPFYDRLIAVGAASAYPWFGAANPADDFAMANLGQAKNLFSFVAPPPLPEYENEARRTGPVQPHGAGEGRVHIVGPRTPVEGRKKEASEPKKKEVVRR